MEKDPYVYQLSEVIKVSKGGEFIDTATIELNAPTMDVFDEAGEFEQLVMRAFMSHADKAQEGAEAPETIKSPKPAEIKIILMASKDVSISDVSKAFIRLAVKVGYVDKDVPLVDSHFKKMEREDFMNMLCGYVSNFTFPSLFSGGGQD